MTDKKNKDKPKLKLVSNNKNKSTVSATGNKLTAKQIGFCKDIVDNGMTLIGAYRNNYNVSPDIKSNTLRMLASRLRSQDNITIFIDTLLKDKERLNMMSAHKLLSGIINYQDDQTHLNDMLELSKSKSLTDSQYIDLFFAIGKAYEDLKQYEKSFEYIRKANEIKNTIINYDFEQEINKFKSIKNTFKNVDFKNTINKNRDSNIIFICGMPRSGTTLVEQIIASHKKVSGAGELIYLQKSIEKNGRIRVLPTVFTRKVASSAAFV